MILPLLSQCHQPRRSQLQISSQLLSGTISPGIRTLNFFQINRHFPAPPPFPRPSPPCPLLRQSRPQSCAKSSAAPAFPFPFASATTFLPFSHDLTRHLHFLCTLGRSHMDAQNMFLLTCRFHQTPPAKIPAVTSLYLLASINMASSITSSRHLAP